MTFTPRGPFNGFQLHDNIIAEVQLTETEDGFSVEASDLGWPVNMAEWPDRFMIEKDTYKMSSRDSNGAIYRHDASGRKVDVLND